MTKQDALWVAAAIESAHSDGVPDAVYDSLLTGYESLDDECCQLRRDLRRARRFAWTLAITCAVLVTGIWGLISRL